MFAPVLFMKAPAAAGGGSGGNNNLSALAVSIGSISPAFASGTTSYSDNVVNGVTQVTVTPTAANAGAVITVNGQVVASGTTSGSINLAVGANAIAVVVNGGGADKTYTLTVTRAASTSNSAPNPTNPQYVWALAGGNLSLVISNPNATDMVISFAAWQMTAGAAGQFSWVTAFPVTVTGLNSVNLTAHAAIGSRFGIETGFSPGTWQCGTDSGTLEADGRQNAS